MKKPKIKYPPYRIPHCSIPFRDWPLHYSGWWRIHFALQRAQKIRAMLPLLADLVESDYPNERDIALRIQQITQKYDKIYEILRDTCQEIYETEKESREY